MKRSMPAHKIKQRDAVRQVPIGGCFLVTTGTSGVGVPCLYERVSQHHVRCLVSALGETLWTDTTMLISRPWFTRDAQIVLLPVHEQNKRIMLAHHGLGLRALAPWVAVLP